MTPVIEDAVLGSDLDGQFYSLLNVKSLDPVPPNLATSDDARLTDVREPIPGSVTNASVADDAAIDQSKLALNGQIPTAWLGSVAGTAAQGDLAEYLANKNQPGGYAGLDATGKIPVSNLPDAVGLATVTSVGLSMPPQFIVNGPNPITGSGTWSVIWADMGGPGWFGSLAGGPPAYQFDPLPVALVPNVDTSQINSGVMATARLPVFIGVGPTHAIGMVPDPGPTGSGILPTDYLGRDAAWHTAPTISVGYQTTLPAPVLTPTPITGGTDRNVKAGYDTTVPANDPYQDAIFFYAFTLTAITTAPTTGFVEFPEVGYVEVLSTNKIWVYAAHPGYNNSPMVHDP